MKEENLIGILEIILDSLDPRQLPVEIRLDLYELSDGKLYSNDEDVLQWKSIREMLKEDKSE